MVTNNSINKTSDYFTLPNAPINPTDAANKDYVDLIGAGFDFKNTCYLSTTADENATYDNGTAGVGATLTNAGTLAAFTADGTATNTNDRILVQFQTDQTENGIYTVTTVGDGGTAWVLTRATDYDTPAEISQGSIIPVSDGATYADTLWIQTDVVTTIGTDPINFNRFSGQAFTTTQYASLVGGPTNTIASVSPSATSGIPLVSQGSSANPAFTTAVVAGGGTGATSFANNNSVLLTGASGTAALTSLASGTSGYVLTSQGAGVAPIWASNASGTLSINTQIFTANGIYTPTSGMVACIVECQGGGGGGSGVSAAGGNTSALTGGGGGGYVRQVLSAATIGASQAVVIGAAGSAGTPLPGSGGNTTFGSLITATGGNAGYGTSSSATNSIIGVTGGSGSVSSGTAVIMEGGPSAGGFSLVAGGLYLSFGSNGGSSYFGGGGIGINIVAASSASNNGFSATSYGAGGGGGGAVDGASCNGGAGAPGVCIVTEYILS